MNKSILAGLIFLSVLIIGLIYIFMDKEPVYTLSIDETLSVLSNDSAVVKNAEFQQLLKQDPNTILFIDVRTPDAFVKGHITGAYNMPANSILSDDHMDVLKKLAKKKSPVILYGETRSDANAPWMILQQLGFNNISILEGGYSGTLLPDSLKPVSAEMPAVNYAEAAKPLAKSEQTAKPEKAVKKDVKVAPVKKAAAAEGGC